MANEFRHKDVGTNLSQAEWEAIGGHIFNSQATGDIVYASSSTQLTRLGAGTQGYPLVMGASVPQWGGRNLDVGAYDVRGATLTADGLTSGRVVFAGASGILSDDSDFLFSVDTLTVTKIGTFEAAGAITMSVFDANRSRQLSFSPGSNYSVSCNIHNWQDELAFYVDGYVLFLGASAITLGTTLVLNGQAFDAGSGDAKINSTAAGGGLIIQSTQDDGAGPILKLQLDSTTPAASDIIGYYGFYARNAGATMHHFGDFECVVVATTTDAESARFEWFLRNAGANNKAMTLSETGALWSDLSMDTLTYKVSGTQVVSAQGAAVANPTDASSTQARLTDLLGRLRTHGLIDT